MTKYPHWNREKERRALQEMAQSFLRQFPEVCERHGWDSEGVARKNVGHNNPLAALFANSIRPDPLTIPPRGNLYLNHYLRGTVSMTAAPGGAGKTTLSVIEAVVLATGRPLLGEAPAERVRVLLWNGEETLDELNRKVEGVCQHYGIPREELNGWLFVASGFDVPLRFGHVKKGAAAVDDKMMEQFFAGLAENKIDVAIADPLISTHELDENNNSHMDMLIKKGFGRGANGLKCSIELPSHVRKGQNGQTELSVEDIRGGSAITNAVRSARLLNTMTNGEATKLGIDPIFRRLYFRIENAKSNYAGPREASWLRLVPVELPTGDKVVVPEVWVPENKLEGITTADILWARGEVVQNEYRKDARAADWFGYALAKRLDLNVHNERDRRKVMAIIMRWLETGILSTETRQDRARRPREYLVPGRAPVP
jgi:hypothetical protein